MATNETFNKYCREKRFRISFEMPNAEYEVLEEHCKSLGVPVATFIKQAIEEKKAKEA